MPAWFLRRLVPGVLVVACAVAVVAFHNPRGAQAEEPRYFAITNARIVPVSGPAIESGTVVIAKGLIAAVGKDVAIPPEAWVIDGKGLTVYPGLIDALTDLGLPTAAPTTPQGGGGQQNVAAILAAQQGQRQARGPEDRPATTPWLVATDELKPNDRRIQTWREAGFTSALAAPSNGIFPGQGSIINLAGEEPGAMVVKTPATLQVNTARTGGFGGGFPSALMGVLAYVKQVFIDTAWYAQAQPVYDAHPRGIERPDYDRTERVILAALRREEPVLVPANNELQIRRMLEMAPEWSSHVVLYGVQEGYATASLIAAKKISVLVNLRWPEAARDADPDSEDSLRTLRFRDKAPSTPAALAKAGVKFAFYSGGIANPKDILRNAKKSIDAGLSADAALRALTLDAADILGVADRLGSIEPGKIANLVVTTGDIFGDRTQVKMVFVDGRRFLVREQSLPSPAPNAGTSSSGLAGKWNLVVVTPQGDELATLDVSQSPDGTLSGTISSRMGSAPLTKGSVSGARFTFGFTMTIDTGPADASVSGTIEGNSIKGTLSIAGLDLDFTGTRAGNPPGIATSENEGGRR
jgi:imidazolonepropionase-like amidohydrolase